MMASPIQKLTALAEDQFKEGWMKKHQNGELHSNNYKSGSYLLSTTFIEIDRNLQQVIWSPSFTTIEINRRRHFSPVLIEEGGREGDQIRLAYLAPGNRKTQQAPSAPQGNRWGPAFSLLPPRFSPPLEGGATCFHFPMLDQPWHMEGAGALLMPASEESGGHKGRLRLDALDASFASRAGLCRCLNPGLSPPLSQGLQPIFFSASFVCVREA